MGADRMRDEAPLQRTDTGLVPGGDGWFVVNAREARWLHAPGRSAYSDFEGDHPFAQIGFGIVVLQPGESMGMYHWEADQEDFLVVAGEAVLVIEGQERQLKEWDFVHCPAGTAHIIVGAGSGNCVVVAVGAREHADEPGWGAYPVDPLAAKHGASAASETTVPAEAYSGLTRRRPAPYRPGWLADGGVVPPSGGLGRLLARPRAGEVLEGARTGTVGDRGDGGHDRRLEHRGGEDLRERCVRRRRVRRLGIVDLRPHALERGAPELAGDRG